MTWTDKFEELVFAAVLIVVIWFAVQAVKQMKKIPIFKKNQSNDDIEIYPEDRE